MSGGMSSWLSVVTIKELLNIMYNPMAENTKNSTNMHNINPIAITLVPEMRGYCIGMF